MNTLTTRLDWSSVNGIYYFCIAYYVVAAFVAPGFFSVPNSWNLLYNFVPLLIVALGQTYVILTAGIDLSVTAVIAVSSIVGAFVMSTDSGLFESAGAAIVFGSLAMLLVGVLIGLFNGIAVTRFKMPAFMVTLTSMMIFGGLAIWLTQSQNIYNLPEAFVNFPYVRWLGIPIPVYMGGLVLFLLYYLLNRTIFGEWIYAFGVSPRTALISGVGITATVLLVYVVSGLCGSVAAILYTARLETGSPVMGQHILLDVIGAVVIGGTSLFGGSGKLQWTVAGAFLMTMLDNSLNLLGLSFFIIMMVKGGIILLMALLNSRRRS